MARQDIAGLLTGMPQQQRPNPNMSSAEWRLAFGQQQSDNMARGLQGAVGGLMETGMAGAASPQEQIQIADLKAQERIGTLATSQDPAELRQAAQLLQQRGKPAEAARALAQAKAIEDEEKALAARTAQITASGTNRTSIANQLRAINGGKFAALADAVINEEGSGRSKALDKALELIGREPTVVQDPALVKEWRTAVAESNYTGTLQDWAMLKKARGINLAKDPVLEAQAARNERQFGNQAKMYEITREQQDVARQQISTGQDILNTVNKGTLTGTYGENILDVASAFQGIYEAAGVAVPEKLSSIVQEAGGIKKAGYDAMLPLIEAQGRGFTDKDREHAVKVLPGLNQSWQYNELSGNLSILQGLKSQEKNQFARQRSLLDEITPTGGETLWTHYLNDLPMSEAKEVTNRGLTYERLQPIRDNENLSQYWVNDRPKGFKVKSGNNVVEMTMQDVKDTAAKKYNMSPRAYLASLSKQGLLIDGVYE